MHDFRVDEHEAGTFGSLSSQMKPVAIRRRMLTLESPKRARAWMERIGGYRGFSIGRARGEVLQKPIKSNKNSMDAKVHAYIVNTWKGSKPHATGPALCIIFERMSAERVHSKVRQIK